MTDSYVGTHGKLVVERVDRPGGHVLTLRGQIDDDADLEPLIDGLAGRVVVDLSQITFMNSLGVRAWATFLEQLRSRGVAVTLRGCSETVVDHMNMVIDARGHADIESFYAPYICDACGFETRELLEVATYLPALRRYQPPELPCRSCGSAMSYDDIPKRSLLFLE